MACTKFCDDTIAYNGVIFRSIFHRIWIIMENYFVKWAPGLRCIVVTLFGMESLDGAPDGRRSVDKRYCIAWCTLSCRYDIIASYDVPCDAVMARSIFCKIITKCTPCLAPKFSQRHNMFRLLGQGMGFYCLWVQCLVTVLPLSLQSSMWYQIVLGSPIKSPAVLLIIVYVSF